MDKMEKLVNYDSASGENSPNNFAPQPLSKAAVPDVPIVSISIKGAGARSTSGQYTPELPSSGTTERKTPVKIQLPNKAHSLTRRPPTPSVPFSKGLESRDKMTVRGASNTATKDFVKPIVPEVEDGEEGEVVEGEIETAKEGLTETGSVVVARQTFGENLQLTAVPTPAWLETQPLQSTENQTPQKAREGRRRNRYEASPSPPRRPSSRAPPPTSGTRDHIKWDETVEQAESRKMTAVIDDDEPRHRSSSRKSSGRSELQQSPTRSSSRPARTAGSSPHKFESRDQSSSRIDRWIPSAEDAERRAQNYGRERRMSRGGNDYEQDRRSMHADHNPPRRRGLEYDTPSEGSVDIYNQRSHRSSDTSYRYDRHDHRNDYPQQRWHNDRNPNYSSGNYHGADNGPQGYGSYRQPYAQDRRHASSQEQPNNRRREPSNNGWNQPQAQASTYPARNENGGWDNTSATSSSWTARDDGQGWDRHPERNSNESRSGTGQGGSGSQHPVEQNPYPPHNERPPSTYARQASQGLAPGNGFGSHKNGTPQSQPQGSQRLSPRPDRYLPSASPFRDEHKQLKRSGSVTLSPNDRSQSGSRSKKARVDPEPSSVSITTDVVMQSADSEVIPPPPRDTPPEPPAEEDIPAAPASPAPGIPVLKPTRIETSLASEKASLALQPQNVTNTDVPSIPFTDDRLPIATVLSEPAATQPLMVASLSSETWPSASKMPATLEAASKRIVSPFKAFSPVDQQVKSPDLPPWSPVLPASAPPGTFWKGNSPLPGQSSPKAPIITMQSTSSPPRAPTPNPNLSFSFLDFHTPAQSGNNTPLVNRMVFPRQKGQRLDPSDDEAVYGRHLIGVTKLDDFEMPTGNDKKEATLGKGTFGVVTRATRKADKRVVALKLLQPPEEAKGQGKAGVLGTTVREIKILKLLNHENIVPLLDIVIERDQAAFASDLKTFLVFPYMDHDLCGLLKNPKLEITDRLVKLYALQLLEGVAYMHHNNIVHRDLKSANILIDNQGLLQIADFGLARAVPSIVFDCDDDLFMTNMVVTRWYRAPELFMGETQYGFEVDMWSVGCILSEMWTRRVLFMGRSDPDQLKLIFDLCGTPEQDYVRFEMVLRQKEVINDNQGADSRKTIPVIEMASPARKRILRDDSRYQYAKAEFKDLLDKFLQVNPAKRISAADALNDRYFWVAPGPLPRSEVAHLNASKERRDQQEEAEAKERSKEIERVQQAQANIQAHMVNNAVLASMPPRPHLQQPPTQLNASAYPMRTTNPYAQAAPNFYAQANMVVHSTMPPNTMSYPGAGHVPALNPYTTQTTVAYPTHAGPRQNGVGFVPNAHQPQGGNLPVHRNHGMQNNGGIPKGNQPPGAVNFRPKFKGNFPPGRSQPASGSQEQPQNQRPTNPDRFG